MENVDYSKELNLLKKLVKNAYKKIIKGKSKKVEIKPGKLFNCDLVTDKDLAVEQYITNAIKKAFPSDNFIGEEYSSKSQLKGRCWVLDPIDGTINFAHNIPMWCIQAAFVVDGECKLSVIYVPEANELYEADKNGAKLNDRDIKLDSVVSIPQALIASSYFESKKKDIYDMQKEVYLNSNDKFSMSRTLGSAGYTCTAVCSARVDGYYLYTNNIWDYMPGTYLCKQAGAVVTQTEYKGKNVFIIGANAEIHAMMEKIYKSAAKKFK